MLDVCLLGTGGMTPMPKRWLTSLMLRCEGQGILVDCGEGTQIALKEVGWSPKAIDIMCFTHYHADHIAGLPGMLLNMTNADRTDPVIMVGPRGLFNVVKSLRCIAPELSFELRFVELDRDKEQFTIEHFAIDAFKVHHSIPCYGYSFRVPRKGKFDPDAARAAGIPLGYWSSLQNGETVRDKETGRVYRPETVLGPERRGLKVTYTTDTRPCQNIVEAAGGADIFICEGMYGQEELLSKAKAYKHCTMQEAARMAADAMPTPRELWFTHYSPSMIYPKQYLNSVREIFPASFCARDGYIKEIKFDED